MFDSLDDRIKHELEAESTPRERIIRYTVISAVSVIVIVALYEVVHLFG